MSSALTSAAYNQVHLRLDFSMKANNMSPDHNSPLGTWVYIILNIGNLQGRRNRGHGGPCPPNNLQKYAPPPQKKKKKKKKKNFLKIMCAPPPPPPPQSVIASYGPDLRT